PRAAPESCGRAPGRSVPPCVAGCSHTGGPAVEHARRGHENDRGHEYDPGHENDRGAVIGRTTAPRSLPAGDRLRLVDLRPDEELRVRPDGEERREVLGERDG